MEIYVEKWFFPLKTKEFLFTGVVEKFKLFPQGRILAKFQKVFHSFSFHIPQALWISLVPLFEGDVSVS